MTVYSYFCIERPVGPPTLFALHTEIVDDRAAAIVAEHTDGYVIDMAKADAEGEAIVKAVVELEGPAEWWAHEGWAIVMQGDNPHPSMIDRVGGWDQVRWREAMPALP